MASAALRRRRCSASGAAARALLQRCRPPLSLQLLHRSVPRTLLAHLRQRHPLPHLPHPLRRFHRRRITQHILPAPLRTPSPPSGTGNAPRDTNSRARKYEQPREVAPSLCWNHMTCALAPSPVNTTENDSACAREAAEALSTTKGGPVSELRWDEIDKQAVDTVRVLAADAVEKVGNGHPGTAMSLAPAAYLLYQHVMRHDPADPHWLGRDRFILSAGHSSLTQYVQLYLGGFGLELDDLKSLRTWGSRTPGHPEYGHTAGVEPTAATASDATTAA